MLVGASALACHSPDKQWHSPASKPDGMIAEECAKPTEMYKQITDCKHQAQQGGS